MKTTVEIPDALLDEARKIASRHGTTLRVLIIDGLRRSIAERRRASGFVLRNASVGGEGLQPGIDAADWNRIRELAIDAWLESPSVTLLAEAEGYWATLKSLLEEGRVAGPMVHDARVAAVCLLHGVRELWTVDRTSGAFAA